MLSKANTQKLKAISTTEGLPTILAWVNEFNELLYSWIIPLLFQELYFGEKYEKRDSYEVDLVKVPEQGTTKYGPLMSPLVREQAVVPLPERAFTWIPTVSILNWSKISSSVCSRMSE